MWETISGLCHLLIFPGGLFALVFGLFLKGVDRRMVARLQRRVGPPLIQPVLDICKLCTKETMMPSTAHPEAFWLAPVIGLAGIGVCASVLPIPGVTEGLPFSGDLFVLLYLFPLPAIALMLAGSASGSPYGGLGFSREMIMMLAYELPLLMILLAVAVRVGGLNGTGAEFSLASIVQTQQSHGSFGLTPAMWPALVAWFFFLPGTMGVPPFDIAEAETELLEGPLLEYSGPLLAVFQLMSAIKTVVVLTIGVVLFFPGTFPIDGVLGGVINLIWFMIKCVVLMFIGLSVARAGFGRFRVDQALRFFLIWPSGLALVSLILTWVAC